MKTDIKALALTLDGFADHLELGGTQCENGPLDIAVFREAARILRDVVPAMEAELAAANARISALQTSVDQLDDWKADYLPVLNTVDNLEKERDESRAELDGKDARITDLTQQRDKWEDRAFSAQADLVALLEKYDD